MTRILGFLKKDAGLVAIEWVGIAAVVLIAGIVIAGAVMTGANTAGNSVANGTQGLASDAADAPGLCEVFQPGVGC